MLFRAWDLELREPDQVGAETEAGTLAGREPNAGRQEVKQSEGHGGHNGDGQDLLNVELLLGDDEGRKRNGEALQEVLDRTCDELSNCETVHLIFWGAKICPTDHSTDPLTATTTPPLRSGVPI